jgi:hypothetical protein
MLEVLCEQRKLSDKKLNDGAVIGWGVLMLASHPWTAGTEAGPPTTTIVIGLLAIALMGQRRLQSYPEPNEPSRKGPFLKHRFCPLGRATPDQRMCATRSGPEERARSPI